MVGYPEVAPGGSRATPSHRQAAPDLLANGSPSTVASQLPFSDIRQDLGSKGWARGPGRLSLKEHRGTADVGPPATAPSLHTRGTWSRPFAYHPGMTATSEHDRVRKQAVRRALYFTLLTFLITLGTGILVVLSD